MDFLYSVIGLNRQTSPFLLLDLPNELVTIILAFLDGATLGRFEMASTVTRKGISSFRAGIRSVSIRTSGLSECECSIRNWRTVYINVVNERRRHRFVRARKQETVKAMIMAAPVEESSWVNKLKYKIGMIQVGARDYKVLCCGLDAAGKTTMLYKLNTKLSDVRIVGFPIEETSWKNYTFTSWDVGGPDKIRPLLRHYFSNSMAMIWVVDSADVERIDDSYAELMKIIPDEDFASPYLLVYCNKQDLPRALQVSEIHDRMPIPGYMEYRFQACSATMGEGIHEGLEWLASKLDTLN